MAPMGWKRLCQCGHGMVAGCVEVRNRADGAHFRGLMSCGLVWSCPVCASKVAVERALEVERAVTTHLARGGGALFLTLTMPHDYGDGLEQMRRTVTGAWSYTLAGRRWVELRKQYGLEFVRVLEVTHGQRGWHPHIHVLLLTRATVSKAEAASIWGHIAGRWTEAITRAGYREPDQLRCTVVNSGAIASYVSKFGIAAEVAGGTWKQGRNGNRHPFAVLSGAETDARDAALWVEWSEGIRGARQVTWSRGTKKRLAIAERTDEEIAEEEVGGVVVAVLKGETWTTIRHLDGFPERILEAAERGGRQAVGTLLGSLPYWPPGFEPLHPVELVA